jgi:transcriptional regulator with XRE-family HTH domain
MKLHENVKFYRESRRLSQDYVSHELGLNQSQYSRRESGAITFDADEIDKLVRILEVTPDELFGHETIIFNNTDQKGGNFGQYISISDELIEQYEQRLTEKDLLISILNDKIALLERLHEIQKK